MAFARDDRSLIAEWWFTVDRALLGAFLALAAIGLVVTAAASPAVAVRKGFDAFHFVGRQMAFSTLAVVVMLVVSLMSPRAIRRLALMALIAAMAAMLLVLATGEEINGARRWLRLGGLSLQPSEIAKPVFAVVAAWAFAEADGRRDVPVLAFVAGLYVALVAMLVQQPDVGQTMLVTLILGALLVASGQPLKWAALLSAAGAAGLAMAYLSLGYVRLRVDRFLNPTPGDNSQVDRALQAFGEGGWLGRGPGEGTIKTTLPDAHTDFILAVVAEEYGILGCLALLGLFAFVVLRPMLRAMDDSDAFRRLAVTGLAVMIAAQALINMGVNVGLLPPKGMTLPLISAGGSSSLGIGLAAGVLLALTRRRPGELRAAGTRQPAWQGRWRPGGAAGR